MKEFLESYHYSSYLDYIGNERIEGNILNVKSFPNYFKSRQFFKEFVENYFTISK